ncbi:C6 zinc cluster transcription factor-like protein [Sporothrix eucalyptigena]|uniref:C6 zinc cluster transcription factor-like protein n=1 Tax=Sporothrix eucalyptigena TaxID=1812306 RepID=A0ABP0BGW9_9PEZI
MSLQAIYIVRHGFRSNWAGDPTTGDGKPLPRLPTGSVADPALSPHGLNQARELAAHLTTASTGGDALLPVERIYCSPYYRCLETVQPLVEAVIETNLSSPQPVRCEPGLVDWFGPAPSNHPAPLSAAELQSQFFPWIDPSYEPSGLGPAQQSQGESMAQLHARLAAVIDGIVRQCDAEGVRSVLLCTHAAPIIALGRVLTGAVPANVGAPDFGVFTCGLSVFRRRWDAKVTPTATAVPWDDPLQTLAKVSWTNGRGIQGGWDCTVNCDCSFLSGGEERGWRFSAEDESLEAMERHRQGIVDAGLELGVVVVGRTKNSVLSV